jgi:hypothetical protein
MVNVGVGAIAFAIHTAVVDLQPSLVLYRLVVLFVLVRGPLARPQWNAARRR